MRLFGSNVVIMCRLQPQKLVTSFTISHGGGCVPSNNGTKVGSKF